MRTKPSPAFVALALLALSVLAIQSAKADPFTGFQLNGSAARVTTSDGPVLELTAADTNQSGSAFTGVSLAADGSFNSHFTFRLSNGGGLADPGGGPIGADGIAFVLQTTAAAPFSDGGKLGYAGIAPSLDIEFDTYDNGNYFGSPGDPDGNHLAVNLNGVLNDTVHALIPTAMNNGAVWYVWIDYAGASGALEIRLSQFSTRPTSPTLSTTIGNLPVLLGGNNVFAGFTGATGSAYNQQDILTWSFSTPEPVGSLAVTLNPAGAVSAGARWQVDGGALQESGAVVTNLSLGNHTVSFSAVSGWFAPANQIATIVADTTTTATGTYLPKRGDLQVILYPSEVVALGAQWQVDGGVFQNSGTVVTNLAVGTHTVAFSTVAGWTTPANQIVTVSENVITPVAGTYFMTVKTWNGSVSTDWLNPTNWTPFGVPIPADTVVLNNNGTITFSAPVTHDGPFRWSAGRISGVPNPFTLGSSAVMTLSPGGFKYLSGTVFNGGTIQTISNITLYVDNIPTAQLVNLPGGVMDSTGTDSFDNGGTVGGVLENRGLFRKSAGGDTFLSPSLVFSNLATVDIQTNALLVYQGWHLGGTYTGAGQLRLLGNNHLRGDLSFANLLLQQGPFDVSDARLHGSITWETGTLGTSTNAACVVAGDGTLTLVPGFHKYLGGTLTNAGLMRLTGNTDLYFSPASVCRLVNAAAGVLDSAGNDGFYGDGLPNRSLENFGLFRKSAGGDTLIHSSLVFTNVATVDIQTNALLVSQGWHLGGTYAGGGQLRLLGDNHLRGELVFSNALFQSGSLDASDARLHGAMTWIAGTLGTSTNTAFVVAGDGTLTLVPGNFKYLAGTLTNEGLARLTGNTELYFSLAPVCRLVNAAAGVLESTGNDNFSGDGLPNRILENHGVLRKSGSNTTTIAGSLGFTSRGTLDLETGVLLLNSPYSADPIGAMRFHLTSAMNYGRLSVNGLLNLAGALVVVPAPGLSVSSNDLFAIVRATVRTNEFSSASGLNPGNGLVLVVTNLPAGVDLLVTGRDLRPVMTPPVLAGGQISFQFLTDPGVVYSIEYNDDLNTTNWRTRGNIIGDGTLKSYGEPATNKPARFFRVLRQ